MSHSTPPTPGPGPEKPAKRSTYRHGNLRQALLEAGIELAREGGPDAVALREATRRAGVAPNAAYRHFANRQDLLHAVAQAAMARVAQAMEQDLAAVPATGDATATARARFRAVGTGYLRFAQEEPGLFRIAFTLHADMTQAEHADGAGDGGLTPFQLLGATLDDLVETGLLPAERRPGAEFLAWASVHGLAALVVEGPLRGLLPSQAEEAGRMLIDMIERGL